MRKLKKTVSILLSVILVFSLFTIVPFEVGAAATSIQYVDRTWDPETNTVIETVKTLENPPTFDHDDYYTEDVYVGNGWLFVDRDININHTMFIGENYHVKLIIADGCTLRVRGSIEMHEHSTLSVYGQQGGTGKLYATSGYRKYAAIGSTHNTQTINIYGANVEANSSNAWTAGIGGAAHGFINYFSINIYGGSVTAEGGKYAAGIGNGGHEEIQEEPGVQDGGDITIYGGTVHAEGGSGAAGIGGGATGSPGNITIWGGDVTAEGGSDGAGIGCGYYNDTYHGTGGNITINGGKVHATGSSNGAGIGGGHKCNGGNIIINGGEVTAVSTGGGSGDGAGIGGGNKADGGTVTINGGTVNARSAADGAGIGGGDGGNGGTVNIHGGKVTAISEEGGAGIGGGYEGNGGTVNIDGGEVDAHCLGEDYGDGAGIGGGDGGNGGTVNISGGKVTAYAEGSSEGVAIGGGKDGSHGTLNIPDGYMVRSGDDPSSADWQYRQNRVSKCKSSKYAKLEPCTRHIDEPDDGYPVWSDFESDNETTHSKHCVACNVTKDTHDHGFNTPVWTWGEEYATAKATFTCSDCSYSETVDATVTKDEAQQTATATAVFRDTTYTVEQSTATPVYPYVRRSWNAETKQVDQTTETVYDYTILTTDTQNTFWAGNGWYVVNSDVTLKGFVSQGDNVNLLICDGAKLTCNEGLTCDVNGSTHHINIFSQQNDSGELVANGKTDYAGIGGGDETSGGVITIHGGKITANGGDDGAGIGGGNHGNAGTITIYGGMINANGGDAYRDGGGAGIGGGNDGNGGTITIYGGNITATGGASDKGGAGAGIGGGDGSKSGNITINGGTINAIGGYDNNEEAGAGIGGGDYGDVDAITINGGTITRAYSMKGSGIGSGITKDTTGMSGTITINGGSVNAASNIGAGIGSANEAKMVGAININGGTVDAVSEKGAGIGAGAGAGGSIGDSTGEFTGTITITGGSVHATSDKGAGIGSGNEAKCRGTISITGGTVVAQALAKEGWFVYSPEAIGHGIERDVSGTLNIGDGLMVCAGDNSSNAIWQYYKDRVAGGRRRYVEIAPCTRHIEEPQDEYPVWSDYKKVDDTKHTQYCVACNAAKELLNHDFSDPVWTWGENYSTATAKFTCPTCHFETTLDATVTKEGTQDGMVTATATVKCLDTTYIDEQMTDIPVYSYIRRSWNEQTKQVEETTETLLSYYVLSSTNDKVWAANNSCEIGDTPHENTNGWYVVDGNVTVKQFISQGDNVNLLLCDGATLTCSEGLICDTNEDGVVHNINIFAQQNGTGELVATGSDEDDSAGIGGWENKHGGVITIHGGKITATNGDDGAGIGGGDNGHGGTVTIYGGTVTAVSTNHGAGIGGGCEGNGGTLNVYGGTVTATSNTDGAGIGGGYNGNGGTVNIYGGTVTATSNNDGAGIGGGYDGNGGTVHIYGGTVTATGEESPAIGGYDDEAVGTLTIADGWMVRSGDNADSTDWRWRDERVSSCQSHHYAQISPCNLHEQEYQGEHKVWSDTIKSDNDATHSHTCLACNGDANIQNHNIAVSWTWAPDCSEATAHLSCATCGFYKDVTASGDQITDEIIDQEKDEHKFTATVTFNETEYTSERGGRPIEYTDLNGETQLAYATFIDSGTNKMTNGWYAVTNNITDGNRIETNGTVNLILCDGAALTAQYGIAVKSGNSLTIWGQSNNTGVLKATGFQKYGSSEGAGIGAGNSGNSGSITINGGTVNATGAGSCAGIGGGNNGNGTVTINGGIVTATGGEFAAGIGSGAGSENIHPNGKITINGGTVNATSGGYAAAIGGGRVGKGEVTITGGDIKANSGGIGSGWELTLSDYYLGDYATIYADRGLVTLDYGENGASVRSQEYHQTDITLSKAFTDGTNIYQAGSVTEDQIKNKTLTPYDGMGSRLAGHSVSLEGDIAVNFYMELSNDIAASQTAYMQFSVPNTSKEYQNQTVKVSEAERKDGYYVFKCRVAAKDMNSKITAQLIDGDSKGIKYTYSVKEYADYLIAHQNESDEFSKAVPLVTAMLNYGNYAENYFSETEALADLNTVIPEGYALTSESLSDGITFDGATLSLKSQTTLSLYFVSANDITLSMDDKTEGVDYELAHKGNEYVIRIRNITAAELNRPVKVKVNNDDYVIYSPMAYCCKAQNSKNAKLRNTVKALYNYWNEAYKYFEIPNAKQIFFTDNLHWGKAYLYAWDSQGDPLAGEFPGILQYETGDDGYGNARFVFYIPDGAAGIVVSNGVGEQTVDITDFNNFTGYWMDGTKDGSGKYIATGWN